MSKSELPDKKDRVNYRCECGCSIFTARQRRNHDIKIDGNGEFLEDDGVYYSNEPFGPYSCSDCGKQYAELPEPTKITVVSTAEQCAKMMVEISDYKDYVLNIVIEHLKKNNNDLTSWIAWFNGDDMSEF